MEKHKRTSAKYKEKNELNKEKCKSLCQTRNFLIMSKLRISVQQRDNGQSYGTNNRMTEVIFTKSLKLMRD